MGLFDTNTQEIISNSLPKEPIIGKRKNLKTKHKSFLRKEESKKILNDILPINEGEEIDIITNGQSNAGGFYEVFAEDNIIEELNLATWIINRDYINLLIDQLNNKKLKKLNFIISNRMRQLTHHSPNFNYLLAQSKEIENFNLRVVNSHAKTYSFHFIKDNKDHFMNICGSGNWSKNPRVENYTISRSKVKYDFKKSWIQELINM